MYEASLVKFANVLDTLGHAELAGSVDQLMLKYAAEEQLTLFDPWQGELFGEPTQLRPPEQPKPVDTSRYDILEEHDFQSEREIPSWQASGEGSEQVFQAYRKQILRILLDLHPDKDPQELADRVMKIRFDDLRKTMLDLVEQHPEYAQQMPRDLQPLLPGVQVEPTPRFTTDPSVEWKRKLQQIQRLEDRKTKMMGIVEAYIEATGEEVTAESPYIVFKKVADWWQQETGEQVYSSTIEEAFKEVGGMQTIEVDEDVPAELYRSLEKSLRGKYQEAMNAEAELRKLIQEQGTNQIERPIRLTEFPGFEPLVQNIKEQLQFYTEQALLSSAGLALFRRKTGYDTRGQAFKSVRDFFTGVEREWYDDPSSVVRFMEDPRDPQKSGWNLSNPTTESWFITKYNMLDNYIDSIERSIETFKKGISFWKNFGKKLNTAIKQTIERIPEDHLEYIVTNYPDQLMKRYQSMLEKLEQDADPAAEYQQDRGVPAGGWKIKEHTFQLKTEQLPEEFERAETEALNLFDILTLMQHERSHKGIAENLAMFTAHLYTGTVREVNYSIRAPAVKALTKRLYQRIAKEATGLEPEGLQVRYEDPAALDIANQWIAFTKGGPRNWASIVQYPKFVPHIQDKKAKVALGDAMRNRLGVAVAQYVTGGDRSQSEMENDIFETLMKWVGESADLPAGQTVNEWVEDALKRYGDHVYQLAADKVKEVRLGLAGNRGSQAVSGENHPVRYSNLAFMIGPAVMKDAGSRVEMDDTTAGHTAIKQALYGAPGHQSNLFIGSVSSAKMARFLIQSVERVLSGLGVDFRTPTDVIETGQDPYGRLEKLYHLLVEHEGAPPVERQMFNESESAFKVRQSERERSNELLPQYKKAIPAALEEVKQLARESHYTMMFDERMKWMSGVGPRAINRSVDKNVANRSLFEHLPMRQLFTGTEGLNDSTLDRIEASVAKAEWLPPDSTQYLHGRVSKDELTDMYRAITGIDREEEIHPDTYIKFLLSNHFGVQTGQQMMAIINTVREHLPSKGDTGNYSQTEIREWFPQIIGKNLKALPKQLAKAAKFAGFVHNTASDVPKEFLTKVVSNSNFDAFEPREGEGNDTIRQFMLAVMNLKRAGGYKGIVERNASILKRLLDQKIIRRGFKKRVIDLTRMFRDDTRLHPDVMGADKYEAAKALITEVHSDLESINNHTMFTEFEDEVKPKVPEMYNLDWAPEGQLFRFRVLRTWDPYHFQVGVDTNCCQTLGGEGADAAIDSYVNPYAGVVIIEIKTPEKGWKTAAQSYFHWVPRDRGYILDNVESNSLADKAKAIAGWDIGTLYAMWSKHVGEKHEPAYLLLGGRYTPKGIKKSFERRKTLSSDPRDFVYEYKHEGRSDWSPGDSYNMLDAAINVPELPETKTSGWAGDIIKFADWLDRHGQTEDAKILDRGLTKYLNAQVSI